MRKLVMLPLLVLTAACATGGEHPAGSGAALVTLQNAGSGIVSGGADGKVLAQAIGRAIGGGVRAEDLGTLASAEAELFAAHPGREVSFSLHSSGIAGTASLIQTYTSAAGSVCSRIEASVFAENSRGREHVTACLRRDGNYHTLI
jgi:hypothetical protein